MERGFDSVWVGAGTEDDLDRLLAAEEAAVAQRLGLWSACQVVRVTDPAVAPAVAEARR